MKTVLDLARQAGIVLYSQVESQQVELLERFAALVLANNPPQSSMAWQEGFEAGRKQELLTLRKIFMDQHEEFKHQHNFWHVAANAIGMRLV